MTKIGKRAKLVRKLARALAEFRAASFEQDAPKEAKAIAGTFFASLMPMIDDEVLARPGIPSLLIATGHPDIIKKLERAGIKSATLSQTEWKLLLNAAVGNTVEKLVNKGLVRLNGLAVVALGRAAGGDETAFHLLMKVNQRFRVTDGDILNEKYRDLMMHSGNAAITAQYLRSLVAFEPGVLATRALNLMGDGDIVGALALHLAGVPLADVLPQIPRHPRAQKFMQATQSNHGRLALQAHCRDLEHFLQNRDAIRRWIDSAAS